MQWLSTRISYADDEQTRGGERDGDLAGRLVPASPHCRRHQWSRVSLVAHTLASGRLGQAVDRLRFACWPPTPVPLPRSCSSGCRGRPRSSRGRPRKGVCIQRTWRWYRNSVSDQSTSPARLGQVPLLHKKQRD
jgi:hypothetical protein